jgi:PTS system mannose-specific IIA component
VIGVVIVTHGSLASELVRVMETIVGPQEQVRAVPLSPGEDVDVIRARIGEAVQGVDAGQGTLVLTDMFGGTPCNQSLPFLAQGKVEILTGVNVPMLLKIASGRMEGDTQTVAELASMLAEYGKKNIQAASEILKR